VPADRHTCASHGSTSSLSCKPAEGRDYPLSELPIVEQVQTGVNVVLGHDRIITHACQNTRIATSRIEPRRKQGGATDG
jgi:hypothetical protein